MRVTGAGDPLVPVSETLPGKLPQRKLVTTAAAGYSSYGNQIGLATGQVDELYHPGYVAKRLEIGAVVGAAPAANVRREVPAPGDIVVLLGGRTGRDGCGGATGSSKAHKLESLETCGAEVQKGNAPVERKLQRLFRDPRATRLIKRCNDFGAGGVSVAIGELADGLAIDLNAVPRKYDGLDGTELAISESQERMAVVLAPGDVEEFIRLANGENLEATVVATVTEAPRLTMTWNGATIVDISREFLNSNGAEKHIRITPADTFSTDKGYGYDLQPIPQKNSHAPFFFSVNVPDGNYLVTAVIGGKRSAGSTTLRGESRRLFYENVPTRKGELIACPFVINKRNKHISAKEDVKIKPRERHKLNWDDKLTLEFNGDAPMLSELTIERVDSVCTVFLCGNSTVVDQDNEPWGSWGQMIPRFFDTGICFANYAESGESANTFLAARRLKKALTQMKAGDYVFMEFGHNDQKQKGPGKGAYYSYMTSLKTFIDEARARGAHPVLVTPTQRRSFGDDGKIMDTHEDYPEAMRWFIDRKVDFLTTDDPATALEILKGKK